MSTTYAGCDYDDASLTLSVPVGGEYVSKPIGDPADPAAWDVLRLSTGALVGGYLDMLSGDPSTDQDSTWRAFMRDAVAVAAHHLDGDRVAAYGALSQALREVSDDGDDDRLAA